MFSEAASLAFERCVGLYVAIILFCSSVNIKTVPKMSETYPGSHAPDPNSGPRIILFGSDWCGLWGSLFDLSGLDPHIFRS